MAIRTLSFLLVCLLAVFKVTGQTSTLYTTENQLSSSLINDIYQDQKGFLWIATEYGLNVFDGNKFTAFHHEENDSTSLHNDYIHTIFEDSRGNLWIGSMFGLSKFDRGTHSFTRIPMYNGHTRTYPHAIQLIERKNGEVWMASSGQGAFKIDVEKNRGECVQAISKTGVLYLTSILEDKEGNLWLGAENDGLMKYNPQNEQIQLFQMPELSENNVSDLAMDHKGNIYIGTLTGGLNAYSPATRSLRQITYKGRKNLQIKSLKYINDQLYIGTDGEGLKVYADGQPEITDKKLEDTPANLAKGKIHAIWQDKDNNLWLGLFQQGVVFIPNRRNPFRYYGRKSFQGSPIGDRCVMSIFQDDKNRLFVGTDNGGLYILDEKFSKNKHFFPQERPYDVSNTILSIYQDTDKDFWLGSYTKGVARFNPETGYCEYIPELLNERVFAITEDKEHNLYFSTYGAGFYVYNKKDKSLTKYSSKEKDSENGQLNELPNNWINALFCDSEGMIWIGHFNGFSCFNPSTRNFINYTSENSIVKGCIGYALTESKDGIIWAGTSNGLYAFNKKTRQTKRYTQQNGMSNNIVCGICEDQKGNIWVSTFNGISRLDTDTETFTSYYSGDGLQGNEFTRGAFFHSANGEVLFGGINGISAFLPERIVSNTPPPPAVITRFTVSGIPVTTATLSGGKPIVDRPVTDTDTFRLDYQDNTFSISFSTLQFDNALQILYKYRIKELDAEWQTTATGVNTVTYNSLQPGKYTFEVYAVNHGYNAPVRTIHILIRPPWFQSWWANLLYVFLFLLICLIVIGYIHAHMQRRKEKTEIRHAKEINEAKLQFFINISHEIRTPLTLIINPLEKLIASCSDSERSKTYMMIYRNSQRILRLINQLMDIRKIDKGQMVLKFRETDLVGFINDVVMTFNFMAKNKHINLEFIHTDEHLKAWIDLNNFDKVLMNLLSNAFKYTPEGGCVCISLGTGENEQLRTPLRKYIEITVSDTGIGLDESQIERIFDRFYQINNNISRNQAGTGVGLHLTRSLVELHHGTITASNRTDTQGSVFTVRIPQGSAHLKMEELETPESQAEPAVLPASNQEQQNWKSTHTEEEEEKKVKAKNNFHLLLVDDEKEILNYLKTELAADYKIETCNNGREAYEYLLNNQTDLVVSDVMMPEMDGMTLCKKIKQNANLNHIPVILLTAKGRTEEQVEGIGLGADAYLVKPFNMEVLKSTIGNLLTNRRLLKNKFSGAQEQNDKVQKIQLKSADEILMHKIMAVINDNLSEPTLNVEMLASSVGLSRVHLHRKLKELTNLSSRDFIRNIRMKQAAELLKEKKLTISEVAYAVGYSNLSHFSNSFKEYFGVAPKEYMQNNRPDNAENGEPDQPSS